MSNKDLQRSYIYPNKATTCGKQIRAQSSHYFYLSHALYIGKRKPKRYRLIALVRLGFGTWDVQGHWFISLGSYLLVRVQSWGGILKSEEDTCGQGQYANPSQGRSYYYERKNKSNVKQRDVTGARCDGGWGHRTATLALQVSFLFYLFLFIFLRFLALSHVVHGQLRD